MSNNTINICLSGLTSCGKTSHSNYLAEMYTLPRIAASEILVREGKNQGLHDVDDTDVGHPWLGAFDDFNKKREKNPVLDKDVDKRILEMMTRIRGVIVESLTLPFLFHQDKPQIPSLLIYLHASHKNRVGRAFHSSHSLSMQDLDVGVLKKDQASQAIISQIWGTNIRDMGEQFSYNDVVLDTDTLDNGDPLDTEKRIYRKKIIRDALTCIINAILGSPGSDNLKKIADLHPELFIKLPKNIGINL